jgi:hypothetical protein
MADTLRTLACFVMFTCLGATALAQGTYTINTSDPRDLIITNLTSDKIVSVTNNPGSEWVTVTVFDDLDGDGIYNGLHDLYIDSIRIEDGHSGSIDVPAGRECEITRFYNTGIAKGSWVFI